jgi:hypothetical protein
MCVLLLQKHGRVSVLTKSTAHSKSTAQAGGFIYGGFIYGGFIYGGFIYGGFIYGGFIYGGFMVDFESAAGSYAPFPTPHTSFFEVKYIATDCDAGRLYTFLLLVILGERSEPQKIFFGYFILDNRTCYF